MAQTETAGRGVATPVTGLGHSPVAGNDSPAGPPLQPRPPRLRPGEPVPIGYRVRAQLPYSLGGWKPEGETREKSPPVATIGPSKRRVSRRVSQNDGPSSGGPLPPYRPPLLSPAARRSMTPKRLVSWLFDRWAVRFDGDGFLARWSPSAQFAATGRGPLACVLHVRDALALDHLSDDAIVLAYEAACDDLIVRAARDAERKRAGR